jgi:5'-nucleotidase
MPIDKSISAKPVRKKPLILLSNDDGVHSKGIRTLAKKLKHVGRIVIVAPDQERSAASHALTLHRPLRVKKIAPNFYAVDGTPADCINLAINEILRQRPDLIVSGINRGANLGDDVHYSGTVSAALEGGLMGIPSIAISVAAKDSRYFFEPAASFAVGLVKKVLKDGLPEGIILNVNVPNLPAKDIKGYEFTALGKRNYDKIIVEKIDPRGNKYYWIGGEDAGFEDLPDTDCKVISEGKISITPLRVRITDKTTLRYLRRWKF